MADLIKIYSDDFIIKCNYKNAQLFKETIESIKRKAGQNIETRFIKLKDNLFRIESRNFGGNSYTPKELFFEELPKLKDFSNKLSSIFKDLKIKVEIVNIEFGIQGDYSDLISTLNLKDLA